MNDELLELALDVAREAAALVRERRRGGVAVAATKSSDVDVVTEADRDSEELIRGRIRGRPPRRRLPRRGGRRRAPARSGVRWVVDPIDGTVNFLYGIPQYAVSIAAERDGEVVAGVVLDVADRRRVHRRPGRRRRPVDVARATASRSPCGTRRRWPSAWSAPASTTSPSSGRSRPRPSARLLPGVRDIRRLGSCALDLCYVAEGTSTGTSRRASTSGTTPPAALVAAGRRGHGRGRPAASAGADLVICAPRTASGRSGTAVRGGRLLARPGE